MILQVITTPCPKDSILNLNQTIILSNDSLKVLLQSVSNESGLDILLSNLLSYGIPILLAFIAAFFALAQVRMNIISSERIRQIGDLRLIVPEFIRLISSVAIEPDGKVADSDMRKAYEQLCKIKLYLNTTTNKLHFQTYLRFALVYEYVATENNTNIKPIFLRGQLEECENNIQSVISIKWNLIKKIFISKTELKTLFWLEKKVNYIIQEAEKPHEVIRMSEEFKRLEQKSNG